MIEGLIIFCGVIYVIGYIALCVWAIKHDKKIEKTERKISSLSMDVAMMGMFWPITLIPMATAYFKDKEYYKYGIPFEDLF